MAAAIKLPSARQPVTEIDEERKVNVFTRQWFLFFQAMYDRVGGPTGEDNNSIIEANAEDAVASETQAMLFSAIDNAGQIPLPAEFIPTDVLAAENAELRALQTEQVKQIEALEIRVGTLRDQIAEIMKDMDGIRQAYIL